MKLQANKVLSQTQKNSYRNIQGVWNFFANEAVPHTYVCNGIKDSERDTWTLQLIQGLTHHQIFEIGSQLQKSMSCWLETIRWPRNWLRFSCTLTGRRSVQLFMKICITEDQLWVCSTQTHKWAEGAQSHNLQRLRPSLSNQSTLSLLDWYWRWVLVFWQNPEANIWAWNGEHNYRWGSKGLLCKSCGSKQCWPHCLINRNKELLPEGKSVNSEFHLQIPTSLL